MTNRMDITAVIYDKRGKILSIGKNSYVKTHPLQAHYAKIVGESHKIYLHAEMDAIIKCKNIEKAHKLVLIAYNSNKKPINKKPCQICLSAIKQTNIKIIEHT